MTELKPVSICAVERKRDEIINRALMIQIGQPLVIERLVDSVLSVLPAGVTYDTVFESVRDLAGTTLTDLDAARLAWRLAGNLPRLKAGKAIPPWASQQSDEWVPLQVLRVVKSRNSKNVIGYNVTTRVMAGTPAPLKISSFWSIRVAKYVASLIGFSRPWRKYPFTDPADLVGLRFYGLIEAARSRSRPEFHEVQCPDSLQQWNRTNVLKVRLRVSAGCPRGYQHACRVCAIGYDQCQYATHPITYVIGFCDSCGKAGVTFDPDNNSPHCLECTIKERLRKQN